MKRNIKITHYAILVSVMNLILYQYPFFKFALANINQTSGSGIVLIFSLVVLVLTLNAMVFYFGLFVFRSIGKWILALFFMFNSIAVYFINTYGIIVDKTMMGNVFNTNFEESTSFFSWGLVLYLIVLGVLPSYLIFLAKIKPIKAKKFILQFALVFCFIVGLVYANASNWLWIDKHSKTLGGLTMPWSYVVNTNRFFIDERKKIKKEILLPKAEIKNRDKTIVVLVIGESARSHNFSLYGYHKKTNPLLSEIENLYPFNAESCATYTTAAVRCILAHQNSSKNHETLPNYLFRNGVEVIWRTTNWGEPNLNIDRYHNRTRLKENCTGDFCNYDEILLNGLSDEIRTSEKSN